MILFLVVSSATVCNQLATIIENQLVMKESVLYLERYYGDDWTVGFLKYDGQIVCNTLEPAWRDNRRNVSCIPEGEYILRSRFSQRWKKHLHITNVPNRSLILLHPGNDASVNDGNNRVDSAGCVLPCQGLHIFRSQVRGVDSVFATNRVNGLVFGLMDKGYTVRLVIRGAPVLYAGVLS